MSRVAVRVLLLSAAIAAQGRRAEGDWLEFGDQDPPIPTIKVIDATPERVVELTAQALEKSSLASRKVELIGDLGETRLAAAVPHLAKALRDPDPRVRAAAARAAGHVQRAEASEALRVLADDKDPSVRLEMVRAGASYADVRSAEIGLKDSDESVFIFSSALATTPAQADQIASRLPSLSPRARTAAARALGRLRAVTHARAVADQLSSTDLPLVIEAITALSQMPAVAETAAVKRQLSHTHPSVRRAATQAMAKLAPVDEQVVVARQMMGDADLTVREAAARLLIAHPSADSVPVLVQQLSAGYPPLRQAAREALAATASISAPSVVEVAVRLMADQDPPRRQDGSFILGRLRSDAAYAEHRRLLKDPDWNVVAQACESLGVIGRQEAAGELAAIAARATHAEELRLDDSAQVEAVRSAFIACGRLRHRPLLELIRVVVPQKRVYGVTIRAPAIWAAGAICGPDDTEIAAMLLSIAHDNSPFEAEAARFEAIKAIGNMGYKQALETLRRDAAESPHPKLRWISHVVADRIAGTQTPYVPVDVPVIADTSIQDLTR